MGCSHLPGMAGVGTSSAATETMAVGWPGQDRILHLRGPSLAEAPGLECA
jgi:hypothetical protein